MPCVCPLTLVLVPWTGLRAEWGLVSPGVGGSGEGKRKGEMPGERRELAEKEAEEEHQAGRRGLQRAFGRQG